MLFRLSFTRNVRIRHSLPDYESVSEMQLQCGNSKYNGASENFQPMILLL